MLQLLNGPVQPNPEIFAGINSDSHKTPNFISTAGAHKGGAHRHKDKDKDPICAIFSKSSQKISSISVSAASAASEASADSAEAAKPAESAKSAKSAISAKLSKSTKSARSQKVSDASYISDVVFHEKFASEIFAPPLFGGFLFRLLDCLFGHF